MVNLVNIIAKAISEAFPEKNKRQAADASWNGFCLDNNFFIRFRLDNPLVIVNKKNNASKSTFKTALSLEDTTFLPLTELIIGIFFNFIITSIDISIKCNSITHLIDYLSYLY